MTIPPFQYMAYVLADFFCELEKTFVVADKQGGNTFT